MEKKKNILLVEDSPGIVEEKINHAAGLTIANDEPFIQNEGNEIGCHGAMHVRSMYYIWDFS